MELGCRKLDKLRGGRIRNAVVFMYNRRKINIKIHALEVIKKSASF